MRVVPSHGSSKPLTEPAQELARLGRPEDALSQVANDPLGLPPIDGGPVGSSRRSVCRVQDSHPTFPSIGNRHRVLRVVHPVHVSRLAAWAQGPYPPGYGFPLPFGWWRSLLGPSCAPCRVGPSLRSADWLKPDCKGVTTFLTCERRWGWVPSLPRGRGVRVCGTNGRRTRDPTWPSWLIRLCHLSHFSVRVFRKHPPRVLKNQSFFSHRPGGLLPFS
jgi:hypothetical protein